MITFGSVTRIARNIEAVAEVDAPLVRGDASGRQAHSLVVRVFVEAVVFLNHVFPSAHT